MLRLFVAAFKLSMTSHWNNEEKKKRNMALPIESDTAVTLEYKLKWKSLKFGIMNQLIEKKRNKWHRSSENRKLSHSHRQLLIRISFRYIRENGFWNWDIHPIFMNTIVRSLKSEFTRWELFLFYRDVVNFFSLNPKFTIYSFV